MSMKLLKERANSKILKQQGQEKNIINKYVYFRDTIAAMPSVLPVLGSGMSKTWPD
jgi:hypothetical protein